ncbi:MAG: toxic anion resistance protein, partial [Ruminococcus sp.]|nr:toxic anion resistance protein [Ruminococcus sp.]
MGIDLSRAKPQTNESEVITTQPVVVQQPEIEVVQQYDIVADRQEMNNQFVGSEEVDKLASEIVLDDLTTIVSFGADAADEISKASDVVLNSMSMTQVDDSGQMLNALAKIMAQFDIEEIKENPGLFKKMFGNAKKQLDKILAKYHTMGDEVDKIYVQLRKYEDEIKQANRKLDQMFNANVEYYHKLVKYILAGEQGCREIEE